MLGDGRWLSSKIFILALGCGAIAGGVWFVKRSIHKAIGDEGAVPLRESCIVSGGTFLIVMLFHLAQGENVLLFGVLSAVTGIVLLLIFLARYFPRQFARLDEVFTNWVRSRR